MRRQQLPHFLLLTLDERIEKGYDIWEIYKIAEKLSISIQKSFFTCTYFLHKSPL